MLNHSGIRSAANGAHNPKPARRRTAATAAAHQKTVTPGPSPANNKISTQANPQLPWNQRLLIASQPSARFRPVSAHTLAHPAREKQISPTEPITPLESTSLARRTAIRAVPPNLRPHLRPSCPAIKNHPNRTHNSPGINTGPPRSHASLPRGSQNRPNSTPNPRSARICSALWPPSVANRPRAGRGDGRSDSASA